MNHKQLIRTIPFLLLLSVSTAAQIRREFEPSLAARERQLEPLIVVSATRYGIDPRLLRQLCFVESRFRAEAVSPKGARGPMQFMPDTAARYGLRNPHDPKAAIDAAARYLWDLLARFNGRVDLALAAYNAGEGTVESFRTGRPLVTRTGKVINARRLVTGGVPPYTETQAYVKSILTSLTAGPFTQHYSRFKNNVGGSGSTKTRNAVVIATSREAMKKDRGLNFFIAVDQ